MSWKLRKTGIQLRVARFLPEVAPAQEPKPVAGLSAVARALLRQRRERETRKVGLEQQP